MKALIIYCHPAGDSFSAAVKQVVCDYLEQARIEMRLFDLYEEGFDPVLSLSEWRGYDDSPGNTRPVSEHAEALKWCDTLIFIYPTWWYGQPAMLKGWLDRVLLPGVAFEMPQGGNIKPGLHHIHRLGVFTTCGASWWLTRLIGSPGRRIILRGVRGLCAAGVKTRFCAHYLMDSSTPQSRQKHLERVRKTMHRLMC